MNIDDEIELIYINGREQLLTYYDGISNLFSESFDKPLDKALWFWAYIDNPFGEPLVSVALHRGRLVGHYAVIPMNLENSSDKLSGFLSMTTMVSVDFRKNKLFQRLAEIVYERINDLGMPSIVFGFPNNNSAPGFTKRLGWTICENYKVVSIKPHQVTEVVLLFDQLLDRDPYTLNLENYDIKKWRTSKPNQSWSYNAGLGLKSIGNEFDLMHITNAQELKKIEPSSVINMILPVNSDLNLDDIEISFPYRFGYLLFNTTKEPNLLVQMSLSDIF
jgi:hypothetical protein